MIKTSTKDKFIIFLDIDGVLFPWPQCCYDRNDKSQPKFKRSCVAALNRLIRHYQADLGMISGWNARFKTVKKYSEFLKGQGIIVNKMFKLPSFDRAANICIFLRQHFEYENFLIIDDGFVKTDEIDKIRIIQPLPSRGLDKYEAAWAIKYTRPSSF